MSNLLQWGPVWVVAFGWALVHFVWQGAVLHALLTLALRFVPAVRSEFRYSLALLTLLLMIVAPVVTAFQLSGRPAVTVPGEASSADTQSSVVVEPLPSVRVAFEHFTAVREDARRASPVAVASGVVAAQGRASSLMPWLVRLWLLGAALFALRFVGGMVLVNRVRFETGSSVPEWVESSVRRLATRLGIGVVAVRTSARVSVPMVVGLLRPVIVVPTFVLFGMPPAQLELILAHELAHVKRWDPLINALQGVIEALLFYHPSVWLVSRIVRVEREHYCDRLTVSLFPNRVNYARTLSELAQLVGRERVAGVAATGGSLVARVGRVLGRGDRPAVMPGLVAALVVLLAIGGVGTTFAVAAAQDPLAQLLANPARVDQLSDDDVARVLRLAPKLQEPEMAALLKIVAQVANRPGLARTYYLYAANTLPELGRSKAIDDLLVQASSEPAVASPTEMVLVGPNAEANYRSVGFLRAPLLEPGFDLNRARLATRGGGDFPAGRQFVYLQTLLPPGDGLDRTRLLESVDLSRLRRLAFSDPERLNLLLVKTSSIDLFVPQFSNPDFTVEELWEQADVSKIDGPWALWVDSANIVTRLTTIGEYPLPDGTVASVPASRQYVCVEDGRVLGSVAGYWASASDEFVVGLFNACVSGAWGRDWNVVPYGVMREAAPFNLVDGAGGSLSLEDLNGQPFVLLGPAPRAEAPLEVPVGRSTFVVAQPEPAVRLAQVETLLSVAGVDARIVVVAVPYAHDGALMDSAAVAFALRDQLDVPVYEDAAGTIMESYAQFVSGQSPLLLFDASNRMVDAYADMPTGEMAFPGLEEATGLSDGLRRISGAQP